MANLFKLKIKFLNCPRMQFSQESDRILNFLLAQKPFLHLLYL